MADKSAIEWTDATWNPVTGCTKVSAGCKNCYAETFAGRGMGPWRGRKFTSVRTHRERLDWPLRKRKPRRIFVNSMSDLFHGSVPDDFIDQVFATMALADRHTFQVLTKRPRRMKAYVTAETGLRVARYLPEGWGYTFPPQNVWLGVSVEDQETADERTPPLLETPAAVRFLSCEPLLGPVTLGHWESRRGENHGTDSRPGDAWNGYLPTSTGPAIDWVIAGGESGPRARPMHPDWARSLRDQCQAAGVPFFFKQWGEWVPEERWISICEQENRDSYDWRKGQMLVVQPQTLYFSNLAKPMYRAGKRRAGRLLDGREWSEFPRAIYKAAPPPNPEYGKIRAHECGCVQFDYLKKTKVHLCKGHSRSRPALRSLR